ncbi:MAG: hypothetical protein ACYCYO_08310 [Bacilli bacterium]
MQQNDALSALYRLIESEGIFLRYDPLLSRRRKILGLYYYDPAIEGSHIILTESLQADPKKHLAVLAEEVGHHFAGVRTNVMKSPEVEILRDELRALRWAVNFLADMHVTPENAGVAFDTKGDCEHGASRHCDPMDS